MTAITAQMVSELRKLSNGAGMMECKKALTNANGDMAKALEEIQKLGLVKAAKTSDRVAAEGKIFISTKNKNAYLLEINCETDFVGKDESFVAFGQQVIELAAQNNISDVEVLNNTKMNDKGTVEENRQALIVRLGEKISLRRISKIHAAEDTTIGSYLHNGRIGAVVEIKGGDAELAKNLAMQAAAMPFEYIAPENVPAERVAAEKATLMEEAKSSGKPLTIIEKMVEGRMNKFLNDMCLTGQPYVCDQDHSVSAILKNKGAVIKNVVRYQVGEGIEKKVVDFAEEVAQQLRGA